MVPFVLPLPRAAIKAFECSARYLEEQTEGRRRLTSAFLRSAAASRCSSSCSSDALLCTSLALVQAPILAGQLPHFRSDGKPTHFAATRCSISASAFWPAASTSAPKEEAPPSSADATGCRTGRVVDPTMLEVVEGFSWWSAIVSLLLCGGFGGRRQDPWRGGSHAKAKLARFT